MAPELPVALQVSAPDSVMKEDGLELTVSLTNQGKEALQEVEVQIAGQGMRLLTCQSVTPPESYWEARRGMVIAKVESLAPGDRCELGFKFTAKRAGQVSLAVSATAAATAATKMAKVKSEVVP